MNSSLPLTTARTMWIIWRLSLRRQMNAIRSVRFARRKKATAELKLGASARRSGTPSKSRGRSLFSVFMFLILGFNGFNIGAQGLVRLSATARNRTVALDKIVVSANAYARILEAQEALKAIEKLSDLAERKEYAESWNRFLDDVFRAEIQRGAFSEEEENARLQQMRDVFVRKGAAGFAHANLDSFWVSRDTWPQEAEPRSVFLRAVSLLVLLWTPVMVFFPLGMNNKDLGQVDWSFEWMYTFPASARALFAGRLFAYAFSNVMVWVFFVPFVVLIYVAGGFGYLAIPMGLGAVIYLAVLSGAIATILEVTLRKFLNLGQIKSAQALFTVAGTIAFMLFAAAPLSSTVAGALVHAAAALPDLLAWNPFSLPVILGLPALAARQMQLCVSGMVVISCVAIAGSLLGCETLTRDGLVKAGGPYQGRTRTRDARPGRNWLRGITGHELLLLARDRNLLVQVLVVPLFLPGFYLLIYSGMASAVSGNFRHAAMMAFGVGAYSLMSSAMTVLNREDKTLWYLLSFPHSLESILFNKTKVWGCLGLLYGGAVLLVLAYINHHLHASAWGLAFLALYGIALYAFIASGIGILATNVLETEQRARLRIDMLYLYMILAAMYANTIYSPSVWTKITQLVLSTLLAFALWQKVKDVCPYLLDPVAQPPRTLGLADGMIAALAFFTVQGVLSIIFQSLSEASFAAQITLAYTLAGLIVGAITLFTLWRQGIPELWTTTGFVVRATKGRKHPVLRGVFWGAIGGAGAALGAFLYLRALSLFPQWQTWKRDAELSSFLTRGEKPLWICVLLIVAAPLFEEFLFRGLIFQGLRRTTGPALAILGSAALFALVHPPVAVIPVFGLGIAAALTFKNSGSLLAAAVTHAVYNACVFLVIKS